MMDPRYLNLWMKCTFFPFGGVRSSGVIFSITSSLACFREAGKNIALDLDLEVFDPICMISPK